MERVGEGRKVVGHWSWNDSPFAKTKEFNGLAIMMALINNWDLKKSNNAIVQDGKEYHYLVSDLGSTFGNSGNWTRSNGNLIAYRESKLILRVSEESVDLRLPTRPRLLYLIAFPFYIQRTHLSKLTDNLHHSDFEWIDRLLSQLSPRQLADAFRASGFSPEEAEGFTQEVRKRIEELQRL